MDKENGKVNEGSTSAASKLSDQTPSLLDAANLFGAYWPRGDAANLFASNFGLSPHAAAALPFGILPPPPAATTSATITSQSGRSSSGGAGSTATSTHNFSTIVSNPSSSASSGTAAAASLSTSASTSSAAVAAAAAAAAYSNAAYSNTLSVAASQAASLGMPAASAAWWSMASHLAAQEYIQRLQATGLNFPLGAAAAGGLGDPYGSLALANLTALGAGGVGLGGSGIGSGGGGGGHHKSKNSSKNSSRSSGGSSNCKDKSGTNRRNDDHHHHQQQQQHHHHHYNQHSNKINSSTSSLNYNKSSSHNSLKYSSASGLTIQPTLKLPASSSTAHSSSSTNFYSGSLISTFNNNNNSGSDKSRSKTNISSSGDTNFLTKLDNNKQKTNASNSVASASVVNSSPSSIFSNPLSLASTNTNSNHHSSSEKYVSTISLNNSNSTTTTSTNINNSAIVNNSCSNSSSPLPQSILSAALEGNSDPNSILGGVRLPPDTEIIKYTSSIVGPKIPGTTNRGRKKTISLDPPPSDEDMLAGIPLSDRVEVIKLPTTNGSVNTNELSSNSEAPLNLSLKPNWSSNASNSINNNNNNNNGSSTHLNSLSNMSVSIGTERIGTDRISRRKPGPRPRRVIPMECAATPPILNIPFNQFNFTTGLDSPRPPSRSEGSDGGSSTSSTSANQSSAGGGSGGGGGTTGSLNHKEGRPRNLGRGVSKPKKNTVASLLAQSRALGIKPGSMMDPTNISMSQHMQLLRSNILDAQRYISEVGGDEKALNRFLQEKFKGALSDCSSTVDASDSDNLTDSNHTDSEIETEQIPMKRVKHYDERLLRVPLEKGWRRETLIRGVTKTGGIKGDVTYSAPESTNKFKQMSDVTQYLEYQKNLELSKENFTFSCRAIIGDYLQPIPPEMQTDGTEYIQLTEEDVIKRLDELKAVMRTNLPLEQRIEMAKKQQAARAAARLDREQQRLNKEFERNERQEAARREKEARAQQILEAKRKRQEELEKQKQEEQQRKHQERELKKQQAAMLKEQEKERRRQHLALIRAIENRRKLEEKERRRQQLLAEKQANREKKLEQRKVDLEILAELRKPCEDLELNQKDLPEYERIPGVKLCGKAFADTLMVFEFLHNFGEVLGFDMESLPTLESLQQALMPNEHTYDAEEELFSVMTHLLVCAIEDPGIPNPARHTTILGQSLRQADITHTNLSEILRIYLYANATGEVKALTGVHFERDREKRVADHHQTDDEMQQTLTGKNAHYYELLRENPTYKMSDLLRDKPFIALTPTDKAAILAFICNELLQNKTVLRQIENSLENMIQHKREKWLLDQKIRKVRVIHSRKIRNEAALEKCHNNNRNEGEEGALDSPHTSHKDDLLDDDVDHEMSDNESVGTQPEEEEDARLTAEELAKKLEKFTQTSENHLQTINLSMSQLRAVTYGEDRYFRRYWSLPKSGGIFVEAMESAEPEEYEQQLKNDQQRQYIESNGDGGIKTLNELDDVVENVDNSDDHAIDKEVSNIVGTDAMDVDQDDTDADNKESQEKSESIEDNEHRKTPNRMDCDATSNDATAGPVENGGTLEELKKSIDAILPEAQIKQEQRDTEENNEKGQFEHSSECVAEAVAGNSPNKKFNLFEKLGQCMERENRSEDDLKADVKAEVKEDLKNEILNELKKEIKCDCVKSDSEENEELKWFSILNKDGITCNESHLTTGNRWDNGNVGACMKDITELKIPIFPPPTNSSGTCNAHGAISSSSTTSSIINLHHNCDSPAPLQMTLEESTQLEYIKKHGMPSIVVKPVPFDKRHGWWRIKHLEELREILDCFHLRGVREKELKRTFIITMQQMYNKGKIVIESGVPQLISLDHQQEERVGEQAMDIDESGAGGADSGGEDEQQDETKQKAECNESVGEYEKKVDDFPLPDEPGSWSRTIAHRVDMFLLEQIEALEDKVANASMQVKGWKVPERDIEDIPYGQVVNLVKNKLSSLEVNIERRYLKPPLGVNTNIRSNQQHQHQQQQQQQHQQDLSIASSFSNNVDLSNIAASAATTAGPSTTATGHTVQQPSTTPISTPSSASSSSSSPSPVQHDDIPKGLANWREAVNRSSTSAQLAMCLYSLESSIAWDKSIMKAVSEQAEFSIQNARKYNSKLTNCQFCHSGDNEDKLLLCDSCDRGYHTYCFKPKMENIPDGDWYCHECLNKATGERNCIVCGRKVSTTSTRLLICEICPRAYHTDCIQPQLHKVPRGKWYCTNCISKKPQKKSNKKKEKSKDSADMSVMSNASTTNQDQSPVSPAASHSSATASDDILPASSATSLPSSSATAVVATASMNCSQNSDQSNSSITLNTTGSPSTSMISTPTTSTMTTITNLPQPVASTSTAPQTPSAHPKKEKEKSNKKLMKELAPCRIILKDLESHDDSWPFLLPVNTKQFPTYKKIIKIPMDLSTIKMRLHDLVYKSKEEFCSDVRQIFNNCETFNEDDSPVGKAGHCMRQFFEARWNELCSMSHS